MVHEQNTLIANGAMISPDWLDVVALSALEIPLCLELVYGFASVAQQFFDVLRNAFEPVILNVPYLSVLLHGFDRFFPGLSLLDLFPQLFYFLQNHRRLLPSDLGDCLA